MSFIIGIRSSRGRDGIVLAADTQINHYEEDQLSLKSTREKLSLVMSGQFHTLGL